MNAPGTKVVNTHELRRGDIVSAHGALVLIDQEIQTSRTHRATARSGACLYTSALVLYRSDSCAIPKSWTLQPDGTHRWSIQGNKLARWTVVARDVSPANAKQVVEVVR
jgi:hypothetical protein